MAKSKWFEDVRLFRAKRKRLGITQHELAKISKVDYAIIASIEAGRRKLTSDEVGDALWRTLARVEIKRRQEPSLPMNMGELLLVGPAYTEVYKKYYEKFSREFAQRRFPDAQSIADMLLVGRERETERKRQLIALENLQSVDDPIISELIESFRRELAAHEARIAELEAAVRSEQKTGSGDD